MKKLALFIFLVFILNSSFAQTYDFDLNDLDGNSVKLSELMQKGPVFVQFWALWCAPCKEEMKVLNDLYGKYKDSGFVYVALNQDSPKSSAKVKSYIESKGYKFPCLLDADLKVFEQFGGQNLPFSVFVGKNGDILKTYTGYILGDEIKLEQDIKSSLSVGKN